ncbi:MAG: coproporphyrinogen dehydrogenase HemZ [Desulfitobacteriaceae bacterium]|nr:coproporphyrinogen dehydrogenase HemZ [Desulfitobacteriaceae bacterium]MDI6877997.1 coproporphyrinogen dehydrogenase HemZ [Desulfitobacteriaceae bacterium]MDI6914168.1 coproporphyrinogen dehydrogenase HemZ [Desulfitobacteriaceae bacterium]
MGIQIKRGFPGTIFLISETIESKVLEGSKALVSAFFPRALIKASPPAQAVFGGQREASLAQVWIRVERVAPAYFGLGEETVFEESSVWGLFKAVWLESGRQEAQECSLSRPEVERILSVPRPGSLVGILTKHVLMRLLSLVTGAELPWGILTGIRPMKLAHRLMDMGLSPVSLENTLSVLYGIRLDKIKLLQDVAGVQQPYLQMLKKHPERVSLYIGIPFCPTRCSYCSFPAYVPGKGRQAISPYLEALKQEIRAVGELMRSLALEGDTLYLGGGTPTILSAAELRELFLYIRKILPLSSHLELTVEAGRPDTLSLEKLKTLAELGTNRLSINPQTMQEKTLKRIGRAHDPQSVVEMYRLARSMEDWVINMDLILGLPGEGLPEMESTLEQLAPLRPDNLTVHALALKRGARERELELELELELDSAPVTAALAEQMQALAAQAARSWGMRPYYLYRQKRIAGNLENIGYALPDRESRYNIAIMEEQQSIIGLGAGAASKILSPTGEGLTNMQHPSDFQAYEEKWQLLHARRLARFSEN